MKLHHIAIWTFRLEELKEYLRGNAQFIADFIQERMPKVKYRIPEATYLGWLDFRAYGMTLKKIGSD